MSKGIYANALQDIAQVLYSIKDAEQMSWFLEDILTPQEVVEMAERIELCRQLLNGKTQRVVAEELGISVTTVNRWARILKFGTGATKQILQ